MPEADVRDHRRILPGHGIVDLGTFRDALDVVGYNRFVRPEIRGYMTDADEASAARAGLNAVCGALDVAGQFGVDLLPGT
jgi:sugar phosphate isomerase/epimerase